MARLIHAGCGNVFYNTKDYKGSFECQNSTKMAKNYMKNWSKRKQNEPRPRGAQSYLNQKLHAELGERMRRNLFKNKTLTNKEKELYFKVVHAVPVKSRGLIKKAWKTFKQ
jgi:hypothetical protein